MSARDLPPGYRIVGDQAVRADALPDTTPEGTLLAEIRKLAHPHGWRTYHTLDSRGSEEGFPDVVLCNGVSLLLYELKSNTGKLTKDQAYWLSLLAHTTQLESGLWRPHDWSAIADRLTRRSR